LGPARLDWRQEQRADLLPVDAYSTANELVITASVPGANPEEVEISIEGETLTIRGETKPPLENVEYVIQERRFGPFSRTLTLGIPVKADQAEAVFDRGVLTLTIPKAEEVRPRVIKVLRCDRRRPFSYLQPRSSPPTTWNWRGCCGPGIGIGQYPACPPAGSPGTPLPPWITTTGG
jgi:HSP20 family protein